MHIPFGRLVLLTVLLALGRLSQDNTTDFV